MADKEKLVGKSVELSSTTYGLQSFGDKSREELIKKEKYIAYFLFFFQGIGMILPWNFFINAHEYFKFKFTNDENIANNFENAFSVGTQIPTTLGLIFNLYLTSNQLVSRPVRVLCCLFVCTACFMVATLLTTLDTRTWTEEFYKITMGGIVINSFCIGIYQGSIFGIAGGVGPLFMLAAVQGIAVGGIFTTISSLVSLSVSNSVSTSAFAYFLTATLITFLCIFAYVFLFRLNFIKLSFKGSVKKSEDNSLMIIQISKKPFKETSSVLQVFGKIYPSALSVLALFVITIAVQPAVISNIKSVNSGNGSQWNNAYFSNLVCFLIFNCGDFAGRIVAGKVKIVKARGPWLPILCLLRVVFIPLFMLCNYQPRSHLKVIFESDYSPAMINMLFSFTNGYLASLCMMYGPSLVKDDEKETAGALMQLFLSFGLSLGAILSYFIVFLI